MTHSALQCAMKLKVLLDKLEKIESEAPQKHEIDDAKQLAREIANESEFISSLK
jgi:hypothetical protein